MRTYTRLTMRKEGLEIGNDLAYYAQFMLRNDGVIESVDMYVSKRSYSIDERPQDYRVPGFPSYPEKHFIMALGGEIDVSRESTHLAQCQKFVELYQDRWITFSSDTNLSQLSAFYLLKTIVRHGTLLPVLVEHRQKLNKG